MTVEVPDHIAEKAVEQMEQDEERIKNVLQSFRSNELTNLGGHYDRLKEELNTLQAQRAEIESELETNQNESELAELFS